VGEPLVLRVGIDVGGTFTKGVALDPSGQLRAVSHVPTTHFHPSGVAEGVLQSLEGLLGGLPPDAHIALVAHSTTQATNALLEGDAVQVGVLALGERADERKIRPLTQVKDHLWAFGATDEAGWLGGVKGQLERWVGQVGAVAVSSAFGVDHPELENQVVALAQRLGFPVSAGSELSGAYGLEMRTHSAVLNASILPAMMRTAQHVREGVARRLPHTPVLIVRGDGGAANLSAFEQTPLSTILSGPAASLSGAILSAGVMEGIFFEVGGTSTNVGAIRDGQPQMKYMTLMGAPTCLRAADIRVIGVAGGSLIRLRGRRIEEVGPRSAYIAGLTYACFAPAGALEGARLVSVAPRPGDPGDYAVLETPTGVRYALTPTCAANALGAISPGGYALGNRDNARTALNLLAGALGAPLERAAEAVLEAAAEKIYRSVAALMKEYGLKGTQLFGGGGAAGVLGPVLARRLGVRYAPLEHSDVISSIGAALALIRVERERSVSQSDPTVADLLEREVGDEAVKLGADPATLQLETRYLPEEGVLRSVASGAHPLSARVRALSEDELLGQARGTLGEGARVRLRGEHHHLYTAERVRKSLFGSTSRTAALVLDARGTRLLRFEHAECLIGAASEVLKLLEPFLGSRTAPQVAVLTHTRLRDYAHLHDPQMLRVKLAEDLRLESQVALIVKRE